MISILLPIYNGIEFINESVSTVIYQTYKDWELIIGINGHPKESEIYKIAKGKAKQHKKAAITHYLEAKKIKNTYLMDDLDYSDNSTDDDDEDEDEDDENDRNASTKIKNRINEIVEDLT